MTTVKQDAITDLEITETSSGNLHIGHDDSARSNEQESEYDLGIIVERSAVPRLIKALRAFVKPK